MRAGDVMTRDVVTVQPDATVRQAARLMDDLNVGSLPVCDGRRLVGIVTDRDIVVRSTADGMRPDRTTVHAIMTEDVCWCFEDDLVEEVGRAMAGQKIRRMPVLDGGMRLVGVIALGDLAVDRAPGSEDTLRSISEPAAPDRTKLSTRPGDAPWPGYGPAAERTRRQDDL